MSQPTALSLKAGRRHQRGLGGASTLSVLTDLGIAVGTTFTTNLLTLAQATNPQTLTFEVQGSAAHMITFGFGVGKVSTLAELATALAAIPRSI